MATLIAALAVGAAALRAPAIPLITTDPFTQNWIMESDVTKDVVRFWDSRVREMMGLIRVDGQAYRFLGNCVPPLPSKPGPVYRMTNKDIAPGNCDIGARDLSDDDCNRWCLSEPDCKAYIRADNRVCYLKSCISPVVDANNHNVGILVGEATSKPNRDVAPGTCDIANRALNQPDCNAWCFATPGCAAYVITGPTCYLKSCSSPEVDAAGHTVYYPKDPHPPRPDCGASAVQTSVNVQATKTIVNLNVANKVTVQLVFLSTVFPDDYYRLSRPISYAHINVNSADGQAHSVQVYFDASAQHVIQDNNEQVVWNRFSVAGTNGVQMGSKNQKVLGRAGDQMNINWGYLYISAPRDTSATFRAGSAADQRNYFKSTGGLPSDQDTRQPRNADDDMPSLAVVKDLGNVKSGTLTVLVAYDDVASVYYFGKQYKGLWTLNGTIIDAIALAAKEFPDMQAMSDKVDNDLKSKLSVHGDNFAALGALAYRQAFASMKLVWAEDRGVAWNFLKEISTNGDMQTMDVIYPGAPLLLWVKPDLLTKLLVPVLAYANNETWFRFTDPYSPHQLGTYPIANDTTAQQEDMPLENTGNMFLMILGLLQRGESASFFYPKYWPLLTSWARYLDSGQLPFPPEQICTDDFTGPLANNSNLALKGIVALHAFGEICKIVKESNCDQYIVHAAAHAKTWQQYAFEANPIPHYKIAYGVANSWSLKYNLVWQKILKLNGPFPWNDVAGAEVKSYLTHNNKYGVPLDLRHTYVKLDWLAWAATLADSDSDFHTIFDRIYAFAEGTRSRVPLTDLYDTVNADAAAGKTGFVARFVVGGIFAKMLV